MFGRRPLMRAAVVGGTAYYAGKHIQRGRQADADRDAQIADLQQQQYDQQQQQQYQQQAAPAAPAAPSRDDQMEELTKLKQLLDQGVLTQAEFDVQKTKILQSM